MTTALPTGLTLAAINTPPTPDQWNSAELAVANTLGLPTTAWQVGSVERTVFAVVANVQAQADVGASIAIQGGYLDFAATGTVTYTDATGTTQVIPVTPDPSIPAQNPTGQLGWLDVLADSVYNVRRILIAPASGTLALLNTSVSTYGPFAASGYHVAQNGLPNKPTYSNKASLTIQPSTSVATVSTYSNSSGVILVTTSIAHGLATSAVIFIAGAPTNTGANGGWAITVASSTTFTLVGSLYTNSGSGGTVYTPTVAAFAADVGGTGSNAAAGNLVTTPVTSLIGVSVGNVGAWLGTNTESNTALAARCRLKLGSLSNGGPSSAYIFFALTAQTYAPLLNPPLTGRPASAITRAISSTDKTTGTVTTTIANVSGAPSGASYPQPGSPPPDDGNDVYAVGAVIQAYAVPLGIKSVVQAASALPITVAMTIYVPIASVAAATSVTQVAVAAYFPLVPIGGVVDPGAPIPNVFPIQGIMDAVAVALSANNIRLQDQSATLNGSASNVTMTATQVATFANQSSFNSGSGSLVVIGV